MLARNEKVLTPIHPNVGLEEEYKRLIRKLIDAMHDSILYWVKIAYRQNEPIMAQDAIPAATLRKIMRKLARRWTRNWNAAAPELAKWFAKAAHKRSDKQLQAILKKHGIAVDFKMTPAMRDVFTATVNQNVNLIKSIPQKYLGQVEQAVYRSVMTGNDLGQLTKDLMKIKNVQWKQAKLIAHHQNYMATASMDRARQTELGIKYAIWRHSHAGKEPRPSHLNNDGKRYKISTGWWDPDEKKHIIPGELINCRCVSIAVIPGFS